MQKQQNKTNVLLIENRRLRAKLNKSKAQIETLNQKHNSVHESLKAMEGKLAQQIEMNIEADVNDFK